MALKKVESSIDINKIIEYINTKIFIKSSYLVRKFGLNRRSATMLIKDLEEEGFIELYGSSKSSNKVYKRIKIIQI